MKTLSNFVKLYYLHIIIACLIGMIYYQHTEIKDTKLVIGVLITHIDEQSDPRITALESKQSEIIKVINNHTETIDNIEAYLTRK